MRIALALPAPVARAARLAQLYDHLRVVVAVALGRLAELELVAQQRSLKIAFSCIIANAAPTQRWRPAPNGIHAIG
jgi:hypothetical protein